MGAAYLQDLSKMDEATQVKFLCSVSHMLTVQVRVAYAEQEIEKVAGINELIHKLLGHMSALLASDPDRYPDEVLVGLLVDLAQERDCVSDLSSAWTLANTQDG